MTDNIQKKIEEQVIVKDRLIYYDPNEFATSIYTNSEQNISNLTWNPEELHMSVDLQVIIPSNNDCGKKRYSVDLGNVTSTSTSTNNKWVSFLQGNLDTSEDSYLTTDYTNISYTEIKDGGVLSKEDLGITNIDINFDAHFYPIVTMKIIDVRGSSLLTPSEFMFDNGAVKAELREQYPNLTDKEISEMADNRALPSFFQALFRFPYPRFLLSVKGFYGNKITFTLSPSDFKTSFNSETGDFEVTISFIGYVYGLYVDLPLDLVIASPYYNSEYWEQQKNNGIFCYNDNGNTGKGIYKYPELIESLESIGDRIDADSILNNKDSERYNKLKEEEIALNELNDSFKEFLKNIPGEKFNGDKYFLTFLDNTAKNNELIVEKSKDLKKNKDEYLKLYDESKNEFTLNLKNTKEEDECNVFYSLLSLGDFTGNNYGKNTLQYFNINEFGYIDKESPYKNETLNNYFNNINYEDKKINNELKGFLLQTNDLSNNKFLIINKEKFFNFITNRKNKIQTELESFKNDISDGLVDVYSNALGFKPTVENIYRMLFAHVDCFMNYFYKNIDEIYNQNNNGLRKTKDLELNSYNSDILLTNGNATKDFTAPFPGYFITKDNTKKYEFPGNAFDKPKLMNIHEVKMINEMCTGVESYSTEFGKVNNVLSNDNNKFYDIITLYDLYKIDNGNSFYNEPWKSLNLSLGENYNDIYNFIYVLLCEYISNKAFDNNISVENDIILNKWIDNIINKFISVTPKVTKKLCENFIKILSKFNDDKVIDDCFNKLNELWQVDFAYFKSRKCIYGIGNNKDNLVLKTSENDNGLHAYQDVVITKYKNVFTSLSNEEHKNLRLSKQPYFSINYSNDNGILGPYSKIEMNHIYNNIEEVGISNISEIFSDKYDSLNGLFSYDTYLKINENPDYDNLFKNNRYSLNDVYIKKKNINKSFFIGYNYSLVDVNNRYTYYNIFKRNNNSIYIYEEIINKVCKNKNIYAFGYILLSFLVYDKSNIELILNKFKENKTSLFKVSKVDLLLLSAFLYRNECINDENIGDIFINYKENNVEVLGNNIDYFLKKNNNKNHFIKSKNSVAFGSHSDSKLKYDEIPSFILESKDILINYYKNWVETELFEKDSNDTFKIKSFFIDDNNFETIKLKKNIQNTNTSNFYSPNTYTQDVEITIYKPNSIPEEFFRKLYLDYEYILQRNYFSTNELYQMGFIKKDDFKLLLSKTCGCLMKYAIEDDNTSNLKEDNKNISSIETKLYFVLKELYNKWLCGYTFDDWKLHPIENDVNIRNERFEMGVNNNNTCCEFNNFVFIDQFYNDISNKMIIDVNSIKKIINQYIKGELKVSLYDFLQLIAEENNLMLISLPVFNNFYSEKGFSQIFTPNCIYSSNNSDRGYGNTYVLIYTNGASKQSDLSNDFTYDFSCDYPDIADILNSNKHGDMFIFNKNNDGSDNYNMPVFGVSYSKQNQMYFKKINVSMDNPKLTSDSLKNLLMISDAGKSGDLETPSFIGQNLFNIWSNRAYTCTIEMMGCMNIMPLMYFQLNNIPLFRGLYMIINVKHNINAGNVTTTFTGVRVSKYHQQEIGKYIISETLFNKIENGASKSGKVPKLTNGMEDIWKQITGGLDVDKSNVQKDFVEDNLLTSVNVKVPIYDSNGNKKFYDIGKVNKNLKINILNVFYLIACGKTYLLEEMEEFVKKGDFPDRINDNYLVNGKQFKFNSIGCYSFRHAKNTNGGNKSSLSWHSFGIALDINASENPFIKKTSYSNLSIKEDTEYCIRTWEHPVVKAFLSQGFGWGIFSNDFDFMHFSYMTTNYNGNDSVLKSNITTNNTKLVGR